MKSIVTLSLAVVLAGAGAVIGAELKSGLQPGDLVGAFDVEKRGGAVNDGRSVGDNFCYRCMLGNKPVVMVFARNADESLGKLARALDTHVAKNADQKLSSFVNLLGDDQSELKAKAAQFAAKNKLENVALVVPHDNQNGPSEFGINPNAEVTVTIYRQGKVTATHALGPGQLNEAAVKAIIKDTGTILK